MHQGQFVTCHDCRNNDICKYREEFTNLEQTLNRDIITVCCKRYDPVRMNSTSADSLPDSLSRTSAPPQEPPVTIASSQRKGTAYGTST